MGTDPANAFNLASRGSKDAALFEAIEEEQARRGNL
jgi:hypothetical protein